MAGLRKDWGNNSVYDVRDDRLILKKENEKDASEFEFIFFIVY